MDRGDERNRSPFDAGEDRMPTARVVDVLDRRSVDMLGKIEPGAE